MAHLGRGETALCRGTRPGSLDQSDEVGVGAQRDGLEVDVGQWEDDRRRSAVVGDDQRLRLDTRDVVCQRMSRFADLDGLPRRISSPAIPETLSSSIPMARTCTTVSVSSATPKKTGCRVPIQLCGSRFAISRLPGRCKHNHHIRRGKFFS